MCRERKFALAFDEHATRVMEGDESAPHGGHLFRAGLQGLHARRVRSWGGKNILLKKVGNSEAGKKHSHAVI